MNLVQRVQDILLRPKDTWPVIAQESADTGSIYRDWLMAVAAVPAVATFVGLSLVGAGGFGLSIRVPLVAGIANMAIGYLLTLVALYLVALVTDALAPTFGGTRDKVAALKVIAYGSTAGLLGGVFNLVPALAVLGLVAGLYSIVLVYTGLPVLMKCPLERAAGYTAAVTACTVLAMIVLGGVSSALLPIGGMGFGRLGGWQHDRAVPYASHDAGVAVEDASRRMEQAARRLEAAQSGGDASAAGGAMGDMVGAMAGSLGMPLPPQALKARLPEAVGDLKRASIESESGQAMGFGGSTATATYTAGARRLKISIIDTGGLAGVAALAGWANLTVDRDTAQEIEKIYRQGSRTVHESARKDGSRAALTVLLANGVIVEAEGRQVELATLRQALDAVDLGPIEAMQRAAKK